MPGCLRPRPLGCSHRPSASGPRAMTEIADPASSPRVSGSDPSARIVHGPVSPADPVDSAARGSDASAGRAAAAVIYFMFILII